MPLPIICLDAELRHFAEEFRSELSKPQLPEADAGPGGSRTRAATASASQESRSPQDTRSDWVSDRG